MLELLIYSIITGILWATVVISEPYQWLLQLLHIDKKPFNCPVCLAFWTFIFACAIQPQALLFAGVAALSANLAQKQYYQL